MACFWLIDFLLCPLPYLAGKMGVWRKQIVSIQKFTAEIRSQVQTGIHSIYNFDITGIRFDPFSRKRNGK